MRQKRRAERKHRVHYEPHVSRLGTESLVTNVQELTCRVGKLPQRIPATVEERLAKLEKEVASIKTLLEIVLDVARDAKYYARRNHMDSQPHK